MVQDSKLFTDHISNREEHKEREAEDYEVISEFGLSSPAGLMCSLCDVDVAATKYCSVCTDKLCLACFEVFPNDFNLTLVNLCVVYI